MDFLIITLQIIKGRAAKLRKARGDAQRPILPVNESKKMGARSAQVRSAAKNH